MSKTYHLTTIQDIYEQVPTDRIEKCLEELARGMLYAKALGELAGEPLKWEAPCEWTDDGLTDQTITLRDPEGGELLTFEARQSA